MSELFGSGRANRRDFNFDESKLRPKQREAALALIEREFADKEVRKTITEIAEDLDLSRTTLYNWNNRDRNFIEYKNYLAADFFDSYLPFVYKKLIDGIGNGSMRGIELFLKRRGELDARSEVSLTTNTDGDMTFDERRAELMARLNERELEGE